VTSHATATSPTNPLPGRRRWLYFVLILGVTALAMAVLIWTGPETRATLQPPPLQRVITEPVREIDFQPVTTLTGQVQPVRKARLHFEVSGQVLERLVEPGQRVEAGELLLKIAAGDYQDAVQENRAILELEREAISRDRRLLELVQEERELQAREVERMERLGRDALAARSQYDASMQQLLRLEAEAARLQHSVNTAAARLRQREAAYQRAQRDLERAQLVAPFAATVDTVNVEIGDYVTSGQSALTLVQVDQLDLLLAVTGRVAAHLRLGQEISVYTPVGVQTGRIVALQVDPDPHTHAHALRIRLDAQGLLSGQLAEAELPGPYLTAALIVPATAVLYEDGQTYLFRITDEHLVRTPITVQQRYQEWLVIDGIQAGTLIVARDVAALADGQPVSVD
jgi:RND family efflux transporter MFP subunit